MSAKVVTGYAKYVPMVGSYDGTDWLPTWFEPRNHEDVATEARYPIVACRIDGLCETSVGSDHGGYDLRGNMRFEYACRPETNGSVRYECTK